MIDWESGITMLVFSLFVNLAVLLLLWKPTNGYAQNRLMLFLPTIIFIVGASFGFVMTALNDDIFGLDQMQWLGVFMYTLSMSIISIVVNLVVVLIRKLWN